MARREYALRMAIQRFPIRIGRRSAPALRLFFGVRPETAWVELGDPPDGELVIRFGWASFRTPLANVTGYRLEGPWTWVKAIGVRISVLGDHAVAFDGSAHGGIRIDLRTPMRWTLVRAPAVYASAEDEAAVGAALEARGIPGEDARRSG
jgi:hypothetical protein